MRVLFVEDEVDLRELIGGALSAHGFEVDLAENGGHALECIERGAPYDALISDIRMPGGMTGIDLSHKARTLYPSLPVILVSGHARTQLPELPPFVDFLPKPYRINQLIQVLRTTRDRG